MGRRKKIGNNVYLQHNAVFNTEEEKTKNAMHFIVATNCNCKYSRINWEQEKIGKIQRAQRKTR